MNCFGFTLQPNMSDEIWMREMERMLAGVEQQATFSLDYIVKCFEEMDRPFDDDFRKVFLQVSKDRLSTVYSIFQMQWQWRQNKRKTQATEQPKRVTFVLNDEEYVSDSNEVQIWNDEIEPEQRTMNTDVQMPNPNDFVPDDQVSDVTPSDSTAAVTMGEYSGHCTSSVPSTSSPVTSFNCQNCEFITENKNSFETHMLTHANRKLRCNRCSRYFVTMQSLKQHKSTHTNKKLPLVCCGCFQRFKKASEKLAHDRVCEKRQYQCYICENVVFFQKERLISHFITHTGTKPFQCQICMKTFTTQNYLRRHLNTIHTRRR